MVSASEGTTSDPRPAGSDLHAFPRDQDPYVTRRLAQYGPDVAARNGIAEQWPATVDQEQVDVLAPGQPAQVRAGID